MRLRVIASPQPVARPRGNLLDKVGQKKRVLQVWQTANVGPSRYALEYMQFGRDELRPLVFLHSIEFPTAPRWGFCVDATEAGFGTYAIRRPGFGQSDRVGGADEQALQISHFLDEAGLEDVVLVAIGSGCPVGYRLAALSRRVTYSVYVNCVFNRDVLSEFRPKWFAVLLAQALQNPAGARVSLMALRQVVKSRSTTWLYENCFQKSPGDLNYVSTFPADFETAWAIGSAIEPETFCDEIRNSLSDDPFLVDGVLSRLRGIALSGAETTETWRKGFEAEAKRVGLPFGYLRSGDFMAAYQSGAELLTLLRACA